MSYPHYYDWNVKQQSKQCSLIRILATMTVKCKTAIQAMLFVVNFLLTDARLSRGKQNAGEVSLQIPSESKFG